MIHSNGRVEKVKFPDFFLAAQPEPGRAEGVAERQLCGGDPDAPSRRPQRRDPHQGHRGHVQAPHDQVRRLGKAPLKVRHHNLVTGIIGWIDTPLKHKLQGDHSDGETSPVDLDLGCSAILSGQQASTVAAKQLPVLSELSQHEVFIDQNGRPVHYDFSPAL